MSGTNLSTVSNSAYLPRRPIGRFPFYFFHSSSKTFTSRLLSISVMTWNLALLRSR
jgi:hypothetical protein